MITYYFFYILEETYDHLGIQVTGVKPPPNSEYAHLDFSDANEDRNVHLNSIYESRGNHDKQTSNDDQTTYGNLDWNGAQAHGRESGAPYVNYDATQQSNDDDTAEGIPLSLDPSQ